MSSASSRKATCNICKAENQRGFALFESFALNGDGSKLLTFRRRRNYSRGGRLAFILSILLIATAELTLSSSSSGPSPPNVYINKSYVNEIISRATECSIANSYDCRTPEVTKVTSTKHKDARSVEVLLLPRLRGGDTSDYHTLPPVGYGSTKINYVASSHSSPPFEFAHGTTTLSFKFSNGIVVAVDSRASLGQFVGSKTVQKVLPISKSMLGTMAGGAADCYFWIRKLRSEARKYTLMENGEKEMSVARASKWLSQMLYANRQLQLSVGTMIMGISPEGQKEIYYVDQDGSRIQGDMFAVGSGATFALGVLDTESTPLSRTQMSKEEAIKLAIQAIRHATYRDAYSGGYIGVYVITTSSNDDRDDEGIKSISPYWQKVFSQDLATVKL